MALMIAVGVASGYLLIAIPNVELITASVALAGWMLGPGAGVFVGVVTMALYGAINAFGLPYPPVWLAQMLGMAGAGFLFGHLRHALARTSGGHRMLACALLGLVITLWYDLLTNLAFPFATGVPVTSWWPYLVAGLPFLATHVISNTVIFAILVPTAWSRVGHRYAL